MGEATLPRRWCQWRARRLHSALGPSRGVECQPLLPRQAAEGWRRMLHGSAWDAVPDRHRVEAEDTAQRAPDCTCVHRRARDQRAGRAAQRLRYGPLLRMARGRERSQANPVCFPAERPGCHPGRSVRGDRGVEGWRRRRQGPRASSLCWRRLLRGAAGRPRRVRAGRARRRRPRAAEHAGLRVERERQVQIQLYESKHNPYQGVTGYQGG
mmetsp:Transcript_73006/g.176157  ORF Transcript_73006/g.176157 Transcript_73006/m.176157 type:complete len:211 (+) Transcript_73006:21-653(+)